MCWKTKPLTVTEAPALARRIGDAELLNDGRVGRAGIGEIVVGLTGNYLGILAHSIPPATSTTYTPFTVWAASRS